MSSENGFANFFVFAKIFAKNVCPRSLCGHRVSAVNDYADTLSAYLTTTRTCVSVVVNYADTDTFGKL